MDNREKILQLIRLKGPVIPSQISKEIGRDLLFTSAMLSELVDKKDLKLTYVKVGGSPVYYLPSQMGLLQTLYNKLNGKQKQVYDLLKNEKVLRDRKLQPIERVALRDLKDFAYPLEVKIADKSEIFWKWYLLSNQEAASIIKDIIDKQEIFEQNIKKEVEAREIMQSQKDMQQTSETKKPADANEVYDHSNHVESQTKLNISAEESGRGVNSSDVGLKTGQKTPEQSIQEFNIAKEMKNANEPAASENEIKHSNDKEESTAVIKKSQGSGKGTDDEEKIIEQVRTMIKKEKKKKSFITKLVSTLTGKSGKEKQETLVGEQAKIDDAFFDHVKRFFDKSSINIVDFKILRKNSEIDFILKIPSAVGEMNYYCKAKNKKRCNDGDLSSAYVQGQNKKLPILFLTTGDLTKRAKEMLDKEFRTISFKKI